LYDVGFSHTAKGSTPADQIWKYALPKNTSTPNLRAMEARDVDAVTDLLYLYLDRFNLALILTKEEVKHWLTLSGQALFEGCLSLKMVSEIDSTAPHYSLS
jgi:glycylpeptide N-tetradecanoyltransferase